MSGTSSSGGVYLDHLRIGTAAEQSSGNCFADEYAPAYFFAEVDADPRGVPRPSGAAAAPEAPDRPSLVWCVANP
jgi:hypothetical protein